MSTTAIINIKTDSRVKKEAQKIASELGLSLSSVLNGFLRNFIIEKKITFSLGEDAELKNFTRVGVKDALKDLGPISKQEVDYYENL